MPRRLRSTLAVLLTCLGLAGVSLASAHGSKHGGAAKDPAAAVVAAARAHLGDDYAWGATGPHRFDCSGLTSTVWSIRGVRVPRTAAQQQAWARPIPAAQALPGDLVFFGDPVTHVGLVERRSGHRITMIDASSSQHGVVRRQVWTSGVVRFGRVPRSTMPPIRPWHHPAAPKPAPARPLVDPHDPGLRGRSPLVGLPSAPTASSATMRRFVALARAQVGSRTWTDTALVTTLWKRAGGVASPNSRAAIVNRTHRVLLRHARVGDLIVYAAPNDHVGIYVGGGRMVDASRALGSVVLRPVWADRGVKVLSWNR